jgi:hypothetical protein
MLRHVWESRNDGCRQTVLSTIRREASREMFVRTMRIQETFPTYSITKEIGVICHSIDPQKVILSLDGSVKLLSFAIYSEE